MSLLPLLAAAAGALACRGRTRADTPAAGPVAPAGPLALPYPEVARRVGSHTLRLRWDHTMRRDGRVAQELGQTVTLRAAAGGEFQLLDDNSGEQGREAVWTGGVLYTRHAGGTFLRRDDGLGAAPALRDEPWSTLRAALDLVGHGLDVSERPGRISFSRAARPRAPPRHQDAARRWRETVKVTFAEGFAELDRGVPVRAALSLRYAFVEDGRAIDADMSYQHEIQAGPVEIAAPAGALPTPERESLVDVERRLLPGRSGAEE